MPTPDRPKITSGNVYSRLAEEDILRRASGDSLPIAAVRVAFTATKLAFLALVFPVRLVVRKWRRQRRRDRVRSYIRGEDG